MGSDRFHMYHIMSLSEGVKGQGLDVSHPLNMQDYHYLSLGIDASKSKTLEFKLE